MDQRTNNGDTRITTKWIDGQSTEAAFFSHIEPSPDINDNIDQFSGRNP